MRSEQGACPAGGFDHHSPEHAMNAEDIYRAVRDSGSVARGENYGGYYVLASYDDVTAAARDHETFSSNRDFNGPGQGGGGISIPPNPSIRLSPDELDPPEWRRVRSAIGPTLAPRAIARLLPRLHEITTYFIDRVIERGQCDLVLDLANPIPAILTLDYLGLPLDEWERFADPIHKMVYVRRDQPAYAEVMDATAWVLDQLRRRIAQARAHAGDGVVDLLSGYPAEGGPFTDGELLEIIFLTLSGGVDTTTALLANTLLYLAERPEDQRRLLADPALLTSATEEFLRFFTPLQSLARTVARDVEVGGVTLRRGDRVLLAWASANRDEAQFEEPDQVRLDRFPNRHCAFGDGIHRCVGSTLARAMFKHVLAEVLRRMPGYQVEAGQARRYQNRGTVNGWEAMPATFTPGPREGTAAGMP